MLATTAEKLVVQYRLEPGLGNDARLHRIAEKGLALAEAMIDSGEPALSMPLVKIILARTSQSLVSQEVDRFEELREMMGGLVSSARRTVDVAGDVIELPEVDDEP